MSISPGKQPPELPGYQYNNHIGSGGNAEVFLYEQDRPRRQVAVKVLNAVGLTDAIRRQFTAEANAMAGLADHPNIASVFSADIAPDGRPYLVMQYYPQANLGVRARREQFSVADVLRIGVQIASAVETSHRSSILHRDIKPHNILTGKFGTPALTDFGISTMKGAGGAEGLSVPWSPPEVLYGTSDGDERSDVYSLGATLWHLLSGRSPFEVPAGDNSTFALMRRIQSDDPPRTGRADVPESLERLLRQTMAKNADARPQRAVDLARGLQAIEQELRLPLTQIVVPDDPASGPAGRVPRESGLPEGTRGYEVTRSRRAGDDQGDWGPAGADDDATKQRAPRVVSPWASTAPALVTPSPTLQQGAPVPGDVADDDPTKLRAPRQISPGGGATSDPLKTGPRQFDTDPLPPRERQLPPEPGEIAGTQPRPGTRADGVIAGESAGDAGSRQGSGRRRGVLIAGVVVAVAAAAGVVVALQESGGTGGQPQEQSTTPVGNSGSQNAIGPGGDAPGVPTVTAIAVSGGVKFSWTYADPAKGDFFYWKNVVTGQVTKAAGASVTVPSTGGQEACIQVEVIRADGQTSAGYSDAVCKSRQ